MIIDRNQFDLTPHSPFDVHMNRVCARQGPLMHYIWGDGLLTDRSTHTIMSDWSLAIYCNPSPTPPHRIAIPRIFLHTFHKFFSKDDPCLYFGTATPTPRE